MAQGFFGLAETANQRTVATSQLHYRHAVPVVAQGELTPPGEAIPHNIVVAHGSIRPFFDPFTAGELEIEQPDGTWMDATDRLLRLSARLGRNESSHLARVLPLQAQVTLDNEDGTFGPERLYPNRRVRFFINRQLAFSGWVRQAVHTRDHRQGIDTTQVHVEGALARLARAQHELSLFVTETVRTGEVINDTLDQAKWPPLDRDIANGQVRLHPAHYSSVLAGRRIHRALPAMRAMEQAEVGLLHEGRGNIIGFQDRFFRELDSRDPVLRFGTLADAIEVLASTNADENWDQIYTVIQVGMERAIVQAERRIWSLQSPLLLVAGQTFTVELTREREASLDNDAVRSVVEWSALRDEDVEGIRVSLINPRRTSITVRAETSGTLTKLELRGRGVAIYGDLTIPAEADAEALALYDRRVLDLPTSFVGDGINVGGDAVKEGLAHAQLLLYRYSRPPITGAVEFDPVAYSAEFGQLELSLPVSVDSSTGLPAAIYHVEGWELHYDCDTGIARCVVRISRRPRRTILVDRELDFQVSGLEWETVGQAAVLGDDLHVASVSVHLPVLTPGTDDEHPVLRAVLGDEVLREWVLQDIPAAFAGSSRATVVRGPGTFKFEARRLGGFNLMADRQQLALMNIVSRPP